MEFMDDYQNDNATAIEYTYDYELRLVEIGKIEFSFWVFRKFQRMIKGGN